MNKVETIKHKLIEYTDLQLERVQIHNILTRLRGEMKKGYTSQAHTDLENLYVRKLAEIDKQKLYVESLIATLDGDELEVMKYRYINGLTWEKVCEVMYYGNTNVHRIHRKALEHLAERI